MKYYEYGDVNLPHVMLIHGGGHSYWDYLEQARALQDKYHVILPVIDGHGEEGDIDYISTENVVDKLIKYIDDNCGGNLFAVGGVSLGGQITIELLSRRKDIAKKAIVESGLCFPQPFISKCSKVINKIFGKLMFSRTFNKWGINKFPKGLRYPDEISELFLRDVPSIRIQNLNKLFGSYYKYSIKDSLKKCEADTIYWYGSKEMKCIKESAKLFQSKVKKCRVIELKDYFHGEINMFHPKEWVEKVERFLLS